MGQQVQPLGAGVETVEHAAKDKQGKKTSEQIHRVCFKVEQTADQGQFEETETQENGVEAHTHHLLEHGAVENGFIPPLGRLFHVLRQRRLPCIG